MAKVKIEDKTEEIQIAFNQFDRERKGYIDASDFLTFIRSLGQNPSEQDAHKWISQLDLNGDGKIEFSEFVRYYAQKIYKEPYEVKQELLSAFKVLDKDGDGYVSSDELYSTLRHMGEKLSEDDAKRMIHLADVDGNGKIDIEEYVKVMCSQEIEYNSYVQHCS